MHFDDILNRDSFPFSSSHFSAGYTTKTPKEHSSAQKWLHRARVYAQQALSLVVGKRRERNTQQRDARPLPLMHALAPVFFPN